jgi:hypothetical protein
VDGDTVTDVTCPGLSVIVAVPEAEPSVAVIVAASAVVPGVYSPVEDIEPPPETTDHVRVSPVLMLPN